MLTPDSSAMNSGGDECAGKGTLFIVSTPIGNLADITLRAIELLRNAHLIAAEDTRRTRILLNHYAIRSKLASYNSHNQARKGPQLIRLLEEGNDIALVSDAGTPGISDPLYHLVQLALDADVGVIASPGPSAVLAALTVSGLPMDRFVFEGFLPRKKGRKTHLEALALEKRTLVLYESPQRILKTLKDLHTALGDRRAALARELTKKFEEVVRGRLSSLIELAETRTFKGEITLILEGCPRKSKEG